MDSPSDIVIFRTDPELKRQFQTILEVTEVDMDLDVMKVVREMRKIDKADL